MAEGRGLTFSWSPAHRPEWDEAAAAYVERGVVGWGRGRRLAKAEDRARAFKAYVGVQHFDPSRWHLEGEPSAVFFASAFSGRRTLALRTYATVGDAVAAVRDCHARLPPA